VNYSRLALQCDGERDRRSRGVARPQTSFRQLPSAAIDIWQPRTRVTVRTRLFSNAIAGPPLWPGTCPQNRMKQTTVRTSHKTSRAFCAYGLLFIPMITLLFPPAADAASLEPITLKAWEEYVQSASGRMEQRLRPDKTFLWVDEAPDRLARVRAGEVVISPVGAQNPKRVPSGLIHDWIGAAFIADATLTDVLQVVRDYGRYKELYKPTVADSRVIATGEASDLFSMRLLYKSVFLKTALDTDYESGFVHVDDRRGYSISRATRIQEIEEYGAPAQHALKEGEGSGVIWRLFSIARYIERDGGVYIELEAIGLSRDIPASLRWIVEPIVRRVSRGSLSTSLQQTENAVRLHVEFAKRKAASGELTAATVHDSLVIASKEVR